MNCVTCWIIIAYSQKSELQYHKIKSSLLYTYQFTQQTTQYIYIYIQRKFLWKLLTNQGKYLKRKRNRKDTPSSTPIHRILISWTLNKKILSSSSVLLTRLLEGTIFNQTTTTKTDTIITTTHLILFKSIHTYICTSIIQSQLNIQTQIFWTLLLNAKKNPKIIKLLLESRPDQR